eukprot:409815_1
MSQQHTCNAQQRAKTQNLFFIICSNILDNPEDDGYQSLRYNVMRSELSDCHCCMQLLVQYGFRLSVSNNQLIFDPTKITELQEMKNKVLSDSIFNHTKPKIHYDEIVIQQLVDLELGSREQCINASSKVLDYTDINEVAEQLTMETVQQWQCPSCTLYNEMDQKYCILCYVQNPNYIKDTGNDEKYDHMNTKYPHCNGAISECNALDELSLVMSDYLNMSDTCTDLDKIDIDLVLNNFLHLLYQHDEDDDFESIYNKISSPDNKCDLLHCHVFARNNRNRNMNKSLSELSETFGTMDSMQMVRRQILDKIHCHYAHCYDIGYRLTTKEKAEHHQTEDVLALLSNKQQKQNKNRKSKFMTTIGDDETFEKQTKMYDFGFPFHYTLDNRLRNKYNSLKEELTSNETAIISLAQFNCELEKAVLHFHSVYCQKRLIKERYVDKWEQIKDTFHSYIEITVEHILVILIYCNFDHLSFEFSKTYRAIYKNEPEESIIRRHLEFYFLGKYLKETVRRLGIKVAEGNVKRFYHGISKRLLFPLNKYNNIHVPLSTSSEMAVAVNFTLGHGLIVEFVGGIGLHINTNNQHISASWCSDYGNEREHLFVQSGVLKFDNIIDGVEGYQLTQILEAINLLNGLNNSLWGDLLTGDYSRNENIAIKLIRHETRMDEWNGLHFYAKALFHEYCSNMDRVDISWEKISDCPQIHRLFSSDKHHGINIGFLSTLHPKLNTIYTHGIPISPMLFEDILNHFTVNTHSEIEHVGLDYVVGMQDHDISGVVKKYAKQFQGIGFSLQSKKGMLGTSIKITRI